MAIIQAPAALCEHSWEPGYSNAAAAAAPGMPQSRLKLRAPRKDCRRSDRKGRTSSVATMPVMVDSRPNDPPEDTKKRASKSDLHCSYDGCRTARWIYSSAQASGSMVGALSLMNNAGGFGKSWAPCTATSYPWLRSSPQSMDKHCLQMDIFRLLQAQAACATISSCPHALL